MMITRERRNKEAYLLLGRDIAAAIDAGQTELDLKGLFRGE